MHFCNSIHDLIWASRKQIVLEFHFHLWNSSPGHLELKDGTICQAVVKMLWIFYYSWLTNNSVVYGSEAIPPINWVLIPVDSQYVNNMWLCGIFDFTASLGSAKLCLTPCHRGSSLIIWETVQWGSIMGRAGLETFFSCFKEFPPRYVPGTDFSGNLWKSHLKSSLIQII